MESAKRRSALRAKWLFFLEDNTVDKTGSFHDIMVAKRSFRLPDPGGYQFGGFPEKPGLLSDK
jgi:hypothetical protein